MLTVYCYEKCTTCKKALKWLDNKKTEFDQKDIKTEHPDEKTLRKLWKSSGLPLKRFFNTSGMIYREMEPAKKASGHERGRTDKTACVRWDACKKTAGG